MTFKLSDTYVGTVKNSTGNMVSAWKPEVASFFTNLIHRTSLMRQREVSTQDYYFAIVNIEK